MSLSTYWVSARYHGASSEWKWYPLNGTFDAGVGDSEDGDCMIYSKGMTVSKPQQEPCNSTYGFICEGYDAWGSQCRCPPQYYGPFCEKTDGSGTYSKANKFCEGENIQVSCAVEQKRIRIEYAAYGVFHDNMTCNDGVNFLGAGQTCLARTSLEKTAAACNGNSFCDLQITNRFFQNNPCIPQKHLDLRYQCVIDDPAVYNALYTTARSEAPIMYCNERVYVNTTYEVTPENTTIDKPCPQGFTGKVTFSCLEGGMWQNDGPDKSGCTEISEAQKLDEQILEGTKEAVDIAASIEYLLKDGSTKTELEDNEVVNLLSDLNQLQKKQLGDSEKTDQERIDTATSFAERTLSIGSVLLSSDGEDQQKSVSVNITTVMDDVAFIVAEELEENTARTVSTDTIDMTCGSVPAGRQQSLSYPGDKMFTNTTMKNTRAVATMPPSAFDDGSNTKSTLALLEYKKIDNIGNRIFQPQYASDLDELINKSVVNTIVFGASASRGNTSVKTFARGEKFEFILKHENTNLTGSVSCAFWDSTNKTETPSGSWSSNGCVVVKSNRTHTTCACDHLTNFAILLDVTGVYQEPMNKIYINVGHRI
ncbi:adhesion G protein-coupled receptor L1 [Strongylocentrotus purpuratus]|uniref:Uncharacterized protein n=1 Tax=Strongylocentrotus purpuratus TaxID=7668 RepID=A0A7M7PMV2_STRPU|nr:adhesion G protein-coupled receptor L1 [Strongylocentrotus purpuratus]